ncbi:MAG TPA: tRNA (adenosine(37)-N6)-threonylcarbamoyltransferase complex dimerization subunit type 1 TsaB [Candidatus Saccharimonadia bacterium]|jgi:tRNA threonylcarbamoyladenosine biosynthesis protein TsaB|nr:tRNA (adenosine(37)-N6)-threonylcarbamoyltransferase complex dimerization subunit type 1 TsaB [Candidatus Saccharimonadia bacterium]
MILALKTDGPVTNMWLYENQKTIRPQAEATWESGRDLADQLLGRIQDFLKQHSAGLNDLKGIIVFSGPGSFTSLRIGHAVASALADSLGIPVCGAMGSDWAETARTALATTPAGRPALPHYGGEAHITRPKP